MPRPQFTLRALLVAMLVVAAFFGGMAVQRCLDWRKKPASASAVDIVVGVESCDLEDLFDIGKLAKKLREAGDKNRKKE